MTPEPSESTSPQGTMGDGASARPVVGGGGWAGKLAAAPWVASTYFAEGLPFSIVAQVSEKFFLYSGRVSLGVLSLTALYQIAWNAKFLWSPLVDRHGTAKRWLCVTEALVGLLVMAIALPAQRGAVGAVAA